MRTAAARYARSALVLATIVLPWVAAPPTAERSNDGRPTTAGTSASIESSAGAIELVTADRPKVSPTSKRSDGFRIVSNVPLAGPALDASSSFAWLEWRSGSIGWSRPLTLHLAERAPPLPSSE